MPTSPTWMAYSGNGINCIDAVPIAIRRGTFCNAFLGQVCHEHSQRCRVSDVVLQACRSHEGLRRARADVSHVLCIMRVACWAGSLRSRPKCAP